MGALFRLVSLTGVMAAGFYVLYLAQDRLTEPQTLTESVSEDAEAVTLGPASDSMTADAGSSAFPSAEGPITDEWDAAPSSLDQSRFTDRTTSKTQVVAEAGIPELSEPEIQSLDFRNPGETSEPFPVTTAGVNNSPSEAIQLVANEDPFAEDPTPQPKPAKQPETSEDFPPLEKPNPFESDDPFGEEELPKSPVKEVSKEDALDSFDPFGEEPVKKPEAVPELKEDAFPGLDAPAPKKKKTEPAEEPAPFNSDDPFAPFPEKEPATNPNPETSPTPKLKEDPFGDAFPGTPAKPDANRKTTPVPEPSEDPFGDFPPLEDSSTPMPKPDNKIQPPTPFGEFPGLDQPSTPKPSAKTPTPASDPFGEDKPELKNEPKPTEDFPAFPGGLPEKTQKTPLKSPVPDNKEDPFADEFPTLEEKTKPQPADTFPGEQESPPSETPREIKPADDLPTLDPLESEPRPEPNAVPREDSLDTLPDLDAFDKLDEKLKENAKEIELAPTPRDPEPTPSFDEPPAELPNMSEEAAAPESQPEGTIPSLTELQGDGVMKPDTPQEMQLPHLEITKQAPPKALLNKPFVYTILVKNVGDVAANEVTVQDQIPKGSNLTGTIPQAELVGRRLVWKMGRIEPGQEQKIAVRIVPVEPGPLGSVATVNFVAEVGAETVVEHPEVTFKMNLPSDAKVGEIVDCQFIIENHGQHVVPGIVLRDIIPEGMHHPAGHDLENPLGDLKPGQRIEETLQLKIMKPGRHLNQAVVTAEGGLQLKQSSTLEAGGDRLTVTRRGPKERFVGRPAIYQNIVTNTSNEVVRDAVVVETLPEGMQFSEADSGGQYHAAGREIHWKISSLNPGQSVQLKSRLIPLRAGFGESVVRVREGFGEEIQMVSHTQIRSYASIGLEMTEVDQAVLTGDVVKMRIEATNHGNASAENVQLRAKIPPNMELLTVRGETRYRVEGRDVVFETLNALPANDTEIIELELKAAAASPAEISVSVQSQEMTRPVMKSAAIDVHARN